MKYSTEAIYQAMSMCGFEAYQAEKLVDQLSKIEIEDPREYAVMTTRSRQISEDRWEVYHPSAKVKSSTTIGEIRTWYEKEYQAITVEQKQQLQMDNVNIIQINSIT